MKINVKQQKKQFFWHFLKHLSTWVMGPFRRWTLVYSRLVHIIWVFNQLYYNKMITRQIVTNREIPNYNFIASGIMEESSH